MADIDVDLPYAATGGWKNRPNRTTPWNAAAGNKYNAAISLIKDQANLALATAEAGGGGGGGGGVSVTADPGGLFFTVTPSAGSSATVTDHGTYITIT